MLGQFVVGIKAPEPQPAQTRRDVAHGEKRATPGARDLRPAGTQAVGRVDHHYACAEQSRLDRHLGGEGVGTVLEGEAPKERGADRPERSVVAQPEPEQHPERDREGVVAQTLVQRHPSLPAADRAAARADDEIRFPRKNGTGQPAYLDGVVSAVGLHEDDGLGAVFGCRSGSRKTRVAVAAPWFAQQHGAGTLDLLGAVVARAVVDEDRESEQVERAQFGEQGRERLRFVENRHDDAQEAEIGL